VRNMVFKTDLLAQVLRSGPTARLKMLHKVMHEKVVERGKIHRQP